MARLEYHGIVTLLKRELELDVFQDGDAIPPKLKRAVTVARLENATYDDIVTLLERE